MGCGCENEIVETISGDTIENSLTTKKKININILQNNKFSFLGLFIFLVFTPAVIVMITPIIVVLLFNKIVLGKNTDLIKLIAFTKDKKIKK